MTISTAKPRRLRNAVGGQSGTHPTAVTSRYTDGRHDFTRSGCPALPLPAAPSKRAICAQRMRLARWFLEVGLGVELLDGSRRQRETVPIGTTPVVATDLVHALPDLSLTITASDQRPDVVSFHGVLSGTQWGTFGCLGPSGRAVSIPCRWEVHFGGDGHPSSGVVTLDESCLRAQLVGAVARAAATAPRRSPVAASPW